METKHVSEVRRTLRNYTNADGAAPDGLANGSDDTVALQAAMAGGPGVVETGPGFFRCGDVTIPAGVTLVGAGRATVIRSNGAKRIFSQEKVNEWRLRDLTLDGEAEGDWRKRKDESRNGVFVTACGDFEISGIEARNFNGAGVQLTWIYTASPFRTNANLFNIMAVGNYAGIRFDERAEYMNASMLGCHANVFGCVIHAGNVKITNSNFTSNLTGVYIEDKDNGSHGSISNCLINHNERYSLHCREVRNGMVIGDCCFFDGDMLLENCVGVNVSSGILSCSITSAGSGTNRIAGNFVIPEKNGRWEFSEATIVRDNFTRAGPWDQNTQ